MVSCEQKNVTLSIAKLDQLSRSVMFISILMQLGVEFKAIDNQYASKLLVYVMAAFAEEECDSLSSRTKDTLCARPQYQRLRP